jgi:SH3-like domain-containing protein
VPQQISSLIQRFSAPAFCLCLAILLAFGGMVSRPAAGDSGNIFVSPAQAQDRKLPYWASIREVPARMRKGPSTDVPVLWEYRRKDLPVKVTAVYQNWRKVMDPDGAEGWMNVRLLSPQRTAIVRESVRPLREAPSKTARVLWRAEAGVVGRLSDCADGWCVLDVRGQRGYIQADHIWGA